MPEVSEVRLTTEYLNKELDNKIITDWTFIGGQYEHEIPEGFQEFYDSLPLLVSHVGCKGKLIYMYCFNEFKQFYIIHSMRMTGCWKDHSDSCSRWYVELDNGKRLFFHDSRCLATLYFTTDEEVLKTTLNNLGPDIMSNEFTLDVWKSVVSKHNNKNITAFLMDQHIISGCGNYIKAEALYYAKINPKRKVGSLIQQETEKLFEALRIIPRMAYINRGLSLRDYTDPKGHKGFQEFELKVYGNKDATRLKTPDGRITYYFPKEQK